MNKIQLIDNWKDTCKNLQTVIADAGQPWGADPNNPIINAVHSVIDNYTIALSATFPNSYEARAWLDWYAQDSNFGETPMIADISGAETLVKTTIDLLKIINQTQP